ncbi:hypothetical protein ACVDFE_00390 [Lentzea chajnantorensis]
MNEQQIEQLQAADAEEMTKWPVTTLVHLRTSQLAGPSREPLVTYNGAPTVFEITEVVPGYPVDCDSEAGPGFWHARYMLRDLRFPDLDYRLEVPAARLIPACPTPAIDRSVS